MDRNMDLAFFTLFIAIGIILGMVISVTIENMSSSSYKNQIKKEIELCEQSLPRYQHCVIKGVLENKE